MAFAFGITAAITALETPERCRDYWLSPETFNLLLAEARSISSEEDRLILHFDDNIDITVRFEGTATYGDVRAYVKILAVTGAYCCNKNFDSRYKGITVL